MYDKLMNKYVPEQLLTVTYRPQQDEVLTKSLAKDTTDFAIMCRK